MIGEFLAAVPGQRFVELARQLPRLLDERGDHRLRVFIGYLHQNRQSYGPPGPGGSRLDLPLPGALVLSPAQSLIPPAGADPRQGLAGADPAVSAPARSAPPRQAA